MKTISFTKYYKFAVTGSVILIVLGLFSIIFHKGLDFGIDFTGGVQITYQVTHPISNAELGQLRQELINNGISGNLQTSADKKEVLIKVKGLIDIDNGIENLTKLRKEGRLVNKLDDLIKIFDKVPENVLIKLSKLYSFLPKQELPDINKEPLSKIEQTAKNIYTDLLGKLVYNIMHSVFSTNFPSDKYDLNFINDSDKINRIVSNIQTRRAIKKIQKYILDNKQVDKLERLEEIAEIKGVDLTELQKKFTVKKQFQTEDLKVNINTASEDELFTELMPLIEKKNFEMARKITNHKINIGGMYNDISELDKIENLDPLFLKDIKDNFIPGPFILGSTETVGPSIGATLRKQAVFIIITSFICIGIYIIFRFDFSFATGAIIALIHDVTITVGIFSVLDKEFDIPVIAAIMTLIGYSLNDTIVVYDRIRENMGLNRRMPLDQVIDVSITQTLSRTIMTSVTTLFAAVSLLIFGPIPTEEFSLAIVIGVVVGTYSSVFIASPIVYMFDRKKREKKKKSSRKKRIK